MNSLLKLFNSNTDKAYLIEQNKQRTNFCGTNSVIINEANSPIHLATMRNIDKGKRILTSTKKKLSKIAVIPFSEQRSVITSAYSSALIELIASMYCNRSLHFYLVLEQIEPLPYLEQLIELSRITLISHHAALTVSARSNVETQVFISIPEFHPKTLSSDHQIDIHGVRCIFSSYPWLLSGKQKIPLYFFNEEEGLNLTNKTSDMYKCLTQSYQASAANIYSWSRLQSHKIEHLEQNFISQVNQLEALLRYVRPKIKGCDLQPTLEQIKLQKTQLLQRSGA
ncbi:MAG: hypothetical protein HRT52_20905 [Colwellia sp.]|nr:hypothetical protein [Colwellia sp.]